MRHWLDRLSLERDIMFNPSHPGEVISEGCLVDGLTVETAAPRLGVSRNAFQRVLDGRSPVSPGLARRMEAIGWSTAPFWLRMQAGYDRAQKDLHHERCASATPPSAVGSTAASRLPTQIAQQCLSSTALQSIQGSGPPVRTRRSRRS